MVPVCNTVYRMSGILVAVSCVLLEVLGIETSCTPTVWLLSDLKCLIAMATYRV